MQVLARRLFNQDLARSSTVKIHAHAILLMYKILDSMIKIKDTLAVLISESVGRRHIELFEKGLILRKMKLQNRILIKKIKLKLVALNLVEI